jgi:hypothetical protein
VTLQGIGGMVKNKLKEIITWLKLSPSYV